MKTISVLGFLVILFTNVLIASPGDSVGTTSLDWQRASSFGQRAYVDDGHHVHITWMKNSFPSSNYAQRRMEWNFRYADGSYFGEMDASPFTSGYGMLDVTRDSNPAMQRTVLCWQFNTGTNAFYPFMDIDAGNGFGCLPNDPKNPPNSNNMLWPTVARVNNGNTLLATDDNNDNFHHLFVTTDDGITWTNPANLDSTATISQFLRSSNNPGSNRVVFVDTKFLTDSFASGQLDNDVYYMLSTDGGVAWGSYTNITHYQPSDTIRACGGTNAVFDLNNNLHIAWTGRHIIAGNYLDASKIFHWDEVSNTISVVSGPTSIFPGGWWGWDHPHGYGSWRLPADEPQLVVDRTTGWIYCLWHGQDDTSDYSLAGWPNGDIYGAVSSDGGLTWHAASSNGYYVNLTNTHTPGGLPGQCEDEDYMTANPFTVGDSIFITYIEDKDAGAFPMNEGDTTNNIVRLWVFHKSLITGVPTVEEKKSAKPSITDLNIYPNPFRNATSLSIVHSAQSMELKIYEVSGRLMKSFSMPYALSPMPLALIWLGDDINGNALPAGVYVCQLTDGNKILTRKIIKLE